MPGLIAVEIIASKIFIIRGKKVMLDNDLALLYGVTTKRLNEQVKRNRKRFPDDFMFQLTPQERKKVVAMCDHLKPLRFSPHLPYAFTEQGVAMLSGVLHSDRAIKVNIHIMRTFTKLRELLLTHRELSLKVKTLEKKCAFHDGDIKTIFDVLRKLLGSPAAKEKRILGFRL